MCLEFLGKEAQDVSIFRKVIILDEGLLKITERVFEVAGPELTDGRDCCVYLINGNGALALVDSGCGESFPQIVENIRLCGFDPSQLEFILLTHAHIDHVGGAPRFRKEFGSKIIVHQVDAPALERGDERMTAASIYGMKLEPFSLDWVISEDEESLSLGDLKLNLLHTPGHTPGSLSLYFDHGGTRVLFGQDIHGPFHPAFGSNIQEWQSSMQKLLSLDADVLCEGHFGVIKPAQTVRDFITGYLERYS